MSETWRPKPEEVWVSNQGHVVMGAGRYENKHGVAIIVNEKWKYKVNWTNCISERMIATSITVNKQPITVLSVYMPHSGYADDHVEKTYNMIQSRLTRAYKSSEEISTLNWDQVLVLSKQELGNTLSKRQTTEENG